MLSSRHLLKNERAESILNAFTVLKEGKLTHKKLYGEKKETWLSIIKRRLESALIKANHREGHQGSHQS